MSGLELRIPPVLVVLFFGMAMLGVNLLARGPAIPEVLRWIGGPLVLGVGLSFAGAGIINFLRARTTANPLHPGGASSLVTSGVYRVTRNPMYLGFLFALLAWGLYLGSLPALVLVLGYPLYMTRFQIVPEERALQEIFGEDFEDYKGRVRRWL